MSRTVRKYLYRYKYNQNRMKWMRTPQGYTTLKLESRALDMLRGEGYESSNRQQARATGNNIGNAWEDKHVTALEEIPNRPTPFVYTGHPWHGRWRNK
jgi:hypothetical protein